MDIDLSRPARPRTREGDLLRPRRRGASSRRCWWPTSAPTAPAPMPASARPEERSRHGLGAGGRRARAPSCPSGTTPRGVRPDSGDHREAGDPPAPARRRGRGHLRRVRPQGGRHRVRDHPAGSRPARRCSSTSARWRRCCPRRSRCRGRRYEHGSRIECYVVQVRKGCVGRRSRCRAPTRTWCKKLFALEVPEIADGTVEIAADRPRGRASQQDRGSVDDVGGQRQGRLHRADGLAGPGRHGRVARREDRHRRLVRRPGRVGGSRPVAGAGPAGRGRRRRGAGRPG